MKLKKVLVSSLVVAALFGVGKGNVANASTTYNIHYASGAPSSANVTSETASLLSTGKDSIVIKSKVYSEYISGSYLHCIGKKFPTIPKEVHESDQKYVLTYSGNTIPKRNVRVTVALDLMNYTNSLGVTATGTIIA